MIEVEIKCKIKDKNEVVERLLSSGFEQMGKVKEIDRYFDNELGNIRANDKALRIRCVFDLQNETEYSQLNFKGQRLDVTTMTRPEFETKLEDAECMEQILNQLGFDLVKPSVVKLREEYQKENLIACVDEVEGLGEYLELEIIVEREVEKPAALKRIEQVYSLLEDLIIERTNISYLSQLQRRSDCEI